MDEPGAASRRLQRALAMARSGMRRYPRALAEAMQDLRGHEPACADPSRQLPDFPHHSVAASWLGHGSVLLRLGGAGVLVDPVLSRRIGPRIGPFVLGPSRLTDAPVHPSTLPPPGLILITHAHYDHLDRPTLQHLSALGGHAMTVVTARRTGGLIPPGFAEVVEADWGQCVQRAGLKITAIRPEHWGARRGIDRGRGYNAYLLESESARVLVAGDTAYTRVFDGVGHVTLAVFGIGAYNPWEHKHATPEQVWRMFLAMGADWLLPVHHSTFELSDEHADEPMRRLLEAAGERSGRVVRALPGEVWWPGREAQEP